MRSSVRIGAGRPRRESAQQIEIAVNGSSTPRFSGPRRSGVLQPLLGKSGNQRDGRDGPEAARPTQARESPPTCRGCRCRTLCARYRNGAASSSMDVRVCSPFVTTKPNGHRNGLTIVPTIIDAHGGTTRSPDQSRRRRDIHHHAAPRRHARGSRSDRVPSMNQRPAC